jgi:hypothetical protein
MKLIVALIIFIPGISHAQVSMIQDKSGETSLLLGKTKTIAFNSGDASMGANMSFYKQPAKGKESFKGFSLKVKSNEGVAKLLDGYDFKPNFQFGIFGGRYLSSPRKSQSKYWYASGGVNDSHFKLLDTVSNKLNNHDFFGYKVRGGINFLGVIGKNPTLSGVSLEFGRYNNTDDLKGADRYEYKMDGSNAIVLSGKKSGFKGGYYEHSMLRLNADFIIFPRCISNQFGIGGYYRGDFGGPFAKHNIGFGFFLGQQGAPDKIVLGVVYQVNDIFNQVSDEPNFRKRTGISLTAGYNF